MHQPNGGWMSSWGEGEALSLGGKPVTCSTVVGIVLF